MGDGKYKCQQTQITNKIAQTIFGVEIVLKKEKKSKQRNETEEE
jgi:hypothetical protein